MSALSLDAVGCNFLAVKEVLDINVNRELLIGVALVVDIAAVCAPAYVLAVNGESLVALDVYDILKR